MKIYGNDGNVIFGNDKYEIIYQSGNYIDVRLTNGDIYRVKIQKCTGNDIIVSNGDIQVIKKKENENEVIIAGKKYNTIKINGIEWITTNLELDTTNSTSLSAYPQFGKYYPWSDMNEITSKLPAGWRIPTQADYINSLCNGSAPKSSWSAQSTGYFAWPNATNSSGFTALPTRHSTATEFNTGILMCSDKQGASFLVQMDSMDKYDYGSTTIKVVCRVCKNA